MVNSESTKHSAVSATLRDVNCKAWIEVNPKEIGKTWVMERPVRFHFSGRRQLVTPPNYRFDRDSFAQNLDTWLASLGHDRMWGTRHWDDGRKIGYLESNRCYRQIIEQWGTPKDVKKARLYFYGLCAIGWPIWWLGKLHRPESRYVLRPGEAVFECHVNEDEATPNMKRDLGPANHAKGREIEEKYDHPGTVE